MRSAPKAMPGREPAQPLAERNRIGARMPPLHPLEDEVVACLQRKMQMRHDPLFRGDEFDEAGIDLDAVERGQAQPFERAHLPEDGANQGAERRGAGKIGAVAREIDARQHHFAIAVGDEAANLGHDIAHRQRPGIAAAIGDDAEAAAMIAAVLNLHIGPRAALHALDHGRGGGCRRPS